MWDERPRCGWNLPFFINPDPLSVKPRQESKREVAQAASLADWVSVKMDSVVEPVWRRINRPDQRLALPKLLEGIRSGADWKIVEKLIVEGRLVEIKHD